MNDKELSQIVVDTMVQGKSVAFPVNAKIFTRAVIQLRNLMHPVR